MSLQQLQAFLFWCAGLNYAVLTIVFLVWLAAGDALYRLHARWFRIDRVCCDETLYLVFALYKIGIWLLFLVPALALCILRATAGSP